MSFGGIPLSSEEFFCEVNNLSLWIPVQDFLSRIFLKSGAQAGELVGLGVGESSASPLSTERAPGVASEIC